MAVPVFDPTLPTEVIPDDQAGAFLNRRQTPQIDPTLPIEPVNAPAAPKFDPNLPTQPVTVQQLKEIRSRPLNFAGPRKPDQVPDVSNVPSADVPIKLSSDLRVDTTPVPQFDPNQPVTALPRDSQELAAKTFYENKKSSGIAKAAQQKGLASFNLADKSHDDLQANIESLKREVMHSRAMKGLEPTPERAKVYDDAVSKLNDAQTAVPFAHDEMVKQYFAAIGEPSPSKRKPADKDYSLTPTGQINFKPENIADGVNQAVADGLYPPKQALEMRAEFLRGQYLAQKVAQLHKDAVGDQKMQALLHGVGVGTAFLAGAPIGSRAGAALLSETGPIGAAIGAAIGGLATGGASAWTAKEVLDTVGEYSDFVKSLNASSQLKPEYDAAGQLVAFGASIPRSAYNLYRLGSVANAAKLADAARPGAAAVIGRQVASGAAGGLAFEGVLRPAFDLSMKAIGLEDKDAPIAPTTHSLLVNTALGVVLAGHGLRFKDYTAVEIAHIMARGKVREDAKIPLDEANARQAVRVAFSKRNPASDLNYEKDGFLEPLTPEEQSVYREITSQLSGLREHAEAEGLTPVDFAAKQAVIPGMFGRNKVISTAAIALGRQREREANAPDTESKPIGLSSERSGTDEVGKKGTAGGAGDQLPRPAGQPAERKLASAEEIPPLHPGDKLITIRRADGTTYQAATSGQRWEGMPGKPLVIRRPFEISPGQFDWGGSALAEGETIVEEKKETPKSSTQLTVPKEQAPVFTSFGASIPDAEVYHKPDATGKEDYGVETDPHITVLYGLTEHEPAAVQKIVAARGPITVTLGNVSVFKGEDYDVLKVDVSGDDLHALNKEIAKLPNEQSFPKYQPHLTIAYLKKGEGDKYVGDKRFSGLKLTFPSVTFSPPSEIRAKVGRPELPFAALPEVSIKTERDWLEGKSMSDLSDKELLAQWKRIGGNPTTIKQAATRKEIIDGVRATIALAQRVGAKPEDFSPSTPPTPAKRTGRSAKPKGEKPVVQVFTSRGIREAEYRPLIDKRVVSGDIRGVASYFKTEGIANDGSKDTITIRDDSGVSHEVPAQSVKLDVPAPINIISKGDWVEYTDDYGKTHQGKVDEVWTTAAIVPTREGVKTRAIRHEFSIVDAAGKAMVGPKSGTPLKKIEAPESKPAKSETKEVKAGEASDLTDDDLDAMLDEVEAEGKKPEPTKPGIKFGTVTDAGGKPVKTHAPAVKREPSTTKAVRPEATPKQPKEKSAADIIADAAKSGVKGTDEAVKGLFKLFGGGKHLGSGDPTFDEKTYAEAKPHFEESYKNFKDAGRSLKDFFRWVYENFGKNVRAYLKRFMQDMREVEKTGKEKDETKQPLDKRGGSPKAADAGATGRGGGGSDSQRGGRVDGDQPGTGEEVGSGGDAAGEGAGGAKPGGSRTEPGAGGRGDASGATRDKRPLRRAKQPSVSKNYVITDSDRLGQGGVAEKIRDNFTAIKLVKQLEAENRQPTMEEKAKLVRYVGWGGIKGVFNPDNDSLRTQAAELKALLTPEEYERARSSIQDAHYTSQTVIDGIYKALQRFGFTGGKMVEGGVGIGNFIGLMPDEMRANSSYIGVERDPLTAKIAQYLYPESVIQLKGFQEANLTRDFFDGSVGNPPFGNKPIYDKNFKESSKFTIHNYFIGKALELTRPGGIVAKVVSRYFLDAADPQAREHIASLGEFLGAIRLPNTAFKENANTVVVTDLVFFKRLPEGVKADDDWTKVVDYTDPETKLTAKLNKWIADHPEMVLGKLFVGKDKMHGGESVIGVNGKPDQDLAADLDGAVDQLPANVYERTTPATQERTTTPEVVNVPDGIKVGGYYVEKGKLFRRLVDENGSRVGTVVELKEGQAERVKSIVPVRDALNSLVRLELANDSSDADIEKARTALNKSYDAFVRKFGYLNSSTNRRAFYDDSDAMRVLGLERDYSSGISAATAKKKGVDAIEPSAKKADIFTKRVNAPYSEVTQVGTPKEALTVSLNQRGSVDVDYMAELTGLKREEIIGQLEGLIFKTPEGEYQSKEQYLSGNVRAKLNAARAALESDREMAGNVAALAAVIPKDIDPFDIIAPVGAPWIPASDVGAFAEALTGSAPRVVQYLKANGGWAFEHRDASTDSTQKWGTPRMPFGEMMKLMLNGKTIVVYDYVDNGEGGEMKVVNQSETELASAKASELRDKWQEWIWQDQSRRERLHRVYNDNYNNYVDFTADGSHLTLPGASTVKELRPHQKNVVWRTITTGGDGLLYDHVVGAGKTLAAVASMMELKRLGRVRKWLVPVPNHLTGQWADAFTELYPNANFLAARPSDFTKDNRQKLFSKILTGDYDAVILGHSSLKKIGTSPEVEKSILNDMLREIVETIEALKAAEGTSGRKGGSRQVAQMEKTKDNIEAKLSKLSDIEGRDTVAMFEELGFDGLLVDEAHEFKNLYYTTQMQNVAGLGNPVGSAKAFDLYLKTRYLRQQYNGKAPMVFLTGTPISNSLVEMFTMQRYLQPHILDDMGLKTLDAWSRVFADVKAVYEVDPTGTGYRMATRFANFQNVGELTAIYKNMADVITMDDLQAQAEVAGKRFPVPKVKGGKPNNLVSERSPEQADYFGVETQLMDSAGQPQFDSEGNPVTAYPQGSINWRVDNMPDDPREDNMLKLTNDARKAGLDMRLNNPSAPDRPQSKINVAVGEIVKIFKDTAAQKGTQLVFCDLSVPASHKARLQSSEHDVYVRDVNTGEIQEKSATLLNIGDASFHIVHVKGKTADQSGYIAYEASTGTHTKIYDHARSMVVDELRERMKALGGPGKQSGVQWLASLTANATPITQDEIQAIKEATQGDEEVAGESGGVSIDELIATQSTFSVYDDMRAKLLKAGIPANEIAFIHDYDTPEKKMKLFKQVNAGEVRILFGSTAKMGAGTNVQRRVVALHHMDAPWRPSDLEQREGRVIRQGNYFYTKWMFPDWDGEDNYGKPRYENVQDYDKDPSAFAVAINRYGTDLTYDTRMWQIIEHKANGIEGFRKADRSTRRIEDVGGEAANAADMKAATSGNPLILEELKLRNELTKLQLLKKAWDRNRAELQTREAYLTDFEKRYQSRVKELNERKKFLADHTPVDDKGKPVFEFWMAQEGIQRGKLSKEANDALQKKITAIVEGSDWKNLESASRKNADLQIDILLEQIKKTDEKGTALSYVADMLKEGKRGYFGKYRGYDFSFEPWERGDGYGNTVKGVTFYKDKNEFSFMHKVTEFSGDEKLTGVGLFQRFDNSLEVDDSSFKSAEFTRERDKEQLAEVRLETAKKFTKDDQLNELRTKHEAVRSQLMNKKKKQVATQQAIGTVVKIPLDQSIAESTVRSMFQGELPPNIRFINDPLMPRGRAVLVAGQPAQITLNLAKIDSPELVEDTVNEELIHAVWDDPAIAGARQTIESLVTDVDRERKAEEGYNPDETEEEAANERARRIFEDAERANFFVRAWRSIMDAIRRLFGFKSKQTAADAARTIMREARRNAPTTRTVQRGAEPLPPEDVDGEGINLADIEIEVEKALADEGVTTKVMGRVDTILDRARLNRAAGAPYASTVFAAAGVPVIERDGLFELAPTATEEDGQRLLEAVRTEIARQNQPDKKNTGNLGVLLNSVVGNMTRDDITQFSPALKRDLYAVAQGERSQRGITLAALAGFSKTVNYVARNVDMVLHKTYSDAFGGETVSKIMQRVLKEFRAYFTDEEVANALKNAPGLEDLIDRISALNRQDEGGRVYRRAQGLLKPKGEKKLAALKADARVEESVREILAQLKGQGIEPKPNPNQKLTAIERLVMLIEPKTAKRINQSLAAAISQAERNAGIKAQLAAADADEREALQAEFAEGADPGPEFIEEGLDLPEFAHWKALRDNLLDYSPITLKLAQDVVKGDFKGTKFGPKAVRAPETTKIDLNKLAVAGEAEVTRVLTGYLDDLMANMDLSRANEETKARVLEMVKTQVAAQLEQARARVRDVVMSTPTSVTHTKTPDQVLMEKINAGIFRDDRLDVPGMVERVAGKGPFKRVTPSATSLVRRVFDTPFHRQSELADNFASLMVDMFGVSKTEAVNAAKVFRSAFDASFAQARAKAKKQAEATLTPKERREVGLKKALWKKVIEAANAGLFDTGEVMQNIARAHGWVVPTNEQIAKVRAMAERIERLKELTARELKEAGKDPLQIERFRRDKQAATLDERVRLKKEIETFWARWTQPINLTTIEGRANLAQAVNEFTSANLLFRVGFIPRQLIDVLTQGGVHTPTRAIATAIERWQSDRTAGRDAQLWSELNIAFKEAYKARIASYRAALIAAKDSFTGRGEARNVDRLMSRIAVFERATQKADEAEARGDTVRAGLLRMFAFMRMGYRVAQAFDNLHGLPAEYQEIRSQVTDMLRENGQTSAEAFKNADEVMGDMRAEFAMAMERAKQLADLNDQKPTKAQLESAAWNIVKSRAYQRMREMGMPADDFEEANRLVRSTLGWNERETGGIGGAVAGSMALFRRVFAKAGLPLPLTAFGNAIGTSINRTLSFTPLGFFPQAFGDSPWYQTNKDRSQRKVEAAAGTSIGLMLFALAAMGVIIVRNRWPRDKEERELWEKQGHRPGTVEINLGDGSFIPISTTVGPLNLVRPYLAAGGAINELTTSRAKAQAKLNDEAARKGLPPGQLPARSSADWLAVAADTAWGSIVGGRTASGLVSSLTDNGLPNASKGTAAFISPLIPGLPLAQEAGRMAGFKADPKTASFLDFIMPMPTSRGSAVNMLGDKVANDNDFQRIVQVLTGGTFPFPVSPGDAATGAAYNALFATGYRPPSINPGKGYAINGEYRPMTGEELGQYTRARGAALKEALAGLGDSPDISAVRAAYKVANARALASVGVGTGEPAQSRAAAPYSGVRAPSFRRVSARSAIGRGRSSRPRSIGLGRSSTRPRSLRPARPLRLSAARGRVGRSRRAYRPRSVRV